MRQLLGSRRAALWVSRSAAASDGESGQYLPWRFLGLATTVLLLVGLGLRAGVSGPGLAAASPHAEIEPSSVKYLAGVPVYNYQRRGLQRHQVGQGRRLGLELDWIVSLRNEATDEDTRAVCAHAGEGGCLGLGSPSKGGVAFVSVRLTEAEFEVLLGAHRERIDFAEPDGIMSQVPEMSDGKVRAATVGHQVPSWGLDRIDQRSGLDGVYHSKADGGSGVHVFVMDTGIRTTHADLAGRAVPALEVIGNGVVVCDPENSSCAYDSDGHGTHCAGTIGGRSYGVAKNVTVHAVKVLDDYGQGSFSWLIAALDWVATNAPRPAVVSASIGSQGNYPSVERAIEAAVAAGILVVVAAGNMGQDACSFAPAYIPAALTVGATEMTDKRAWYSNYGKCVDLYAPGTDIASDSAVDDDGTEMLSGSSMACPHVAGAAALVFQALPTLTPGQVVRILLNRSTAVVRDSRDTKNLLLFIDPDDVDPRPAQQPAACSANAACEGLAGDCCPTAAGVLLLCCDGISVERVNTTAAPAPSAASCSSHPECARLGLAGECCPTAGPNGLLLSCCDTQR